jgi:hypothetical protein
MLAPVSIISSSATGGQMEDQVDRWLRLSNGWEIFFTASDRLLKTQAMTVIYYLVFEKAIAEQWHNDITRKRLVEFEDERSANRKKAEEDITKAKYELLEFDRMALQGSNDAASIRARFNTLATYLRAY